ncbi:glycosyl hydrolase family 28-related protein [Bacillus sp. N1-1]|uniref:glycosyl hydrolase family 28-related protein n=1 Tax=Bacillus sp. N1-1 TaxID=2682541 RepID=UPI001318775D|nr:glycosyl hydrolase family 28-related protein [Bacillus sp. N1-1]QHA93644.1 hypothetical protein GNK04_20655 [Bacillus sp. N1-1]
MTNRVISMIAMILSLIAITLCLYVWINVEDNALTQVNTQPSNSVSNENPQALLISDFGAVGDGKTDDSKAIQEAIDYAQESAVGSVHLTGNRNYLIKSGLTLKEGTELKLDRNSKILVDGNFRVVTLEKSSSISGGTIEVVNPIFQSDVLYLDGKYEYYGIWNTTQVNNVRLINSSGSLKGTALSLFAGGSSHQITFVNFDTIGISGFETGLKLETVDPGDGSYSWINGNTFENFSMEQCLTFIELIGDVTVPNESSGNVFENLQIQLGTKTENVLVVDGSANTFEGVIWDTQLLSQQAPVIRLSEQSKGNQVMTNLESSYIEDNGIQNQVSPK